jgi:hypothetical protein
MKKSLDEKRDGFNRREWLNKARGDSQLFCQAGTLKGIDPKAGYRTTWTR